MHTDRPPFSVFSQGPFHENAVILALNMSGEGFPLVNIEEFVLEDDPSAISEVQVICKSSVSNIRYSSSREVMKHKVSDATSLKGADIIF